MAGESLLQYVIGTAEPPESTPFDVNLIGEYNIAGEMWEIESLFNKVGIRILSHITGDGRFEEICYAHHAKANMVVCSRALINMARKMEERYSIPYFEGSFYGSSETSTSLRQMARLLKDEKLSKQIEELIKGEEEKLNRDLVEARQILKGKKVVLYTGGVKSWSVISALQDLGMDIVAVGTNKSTQEDIVRIKERVGHNVELIESGGATRILKVIQSKKADFLIAGGRNMYLALKEQIPFLDINQERHTAYAGYSGLKRLAQHLMTSIQHPVFELAQRKTSWEGGFTFDR